jgi:pimeloyl-ACP methyl ester carboxylesterase
MSGVFYIGLGDQFDGDKVQPFPPGSVIVLPGNTSHFHWAKSGEYVTQVTAIGPLGRDRRQLLITTAMGIAAAVAAATVLATSGLAQSAREIRGPSPYVAIQNEPAPKPIVAAQNVTSADQIEHHIAKIDGTRFHYVTAGTGDPVLLIPGWPESWIAWRKVLPLLVSAGRRVVVLDPRGFGESDKPAGGYDLDTAARDLHGFLEATNLATAGGIDIIAHDVGTWIAHAHAANYPADVRRLVLTESNIPGITAFAAGIPNETANLKSWQFAFNRLNDLPEMLVQGRERAYLAWIFATKSFRSYAIDSAALEEYTRQYSAPGAMRAGFAWYRANFDAEGLAQAKARAAKRLTMPVLALGGSEGVGDALRATVATLGDRVQGGSITGCGHFLPEECPDELTEAVLKFWQSTPR